MKKKIIISLLVLVLIGVIYALYQYNKPHKNIAKEKPVAQSKADELFNQFSADESLANKNYLGKIVQVSGLVYSLERTEKNDVNVLLLNEGEMFGVTCNFSQGLLQENEIKKGELITLKGECAGMLSDVVLIRCVIIEK